jgi:hypothetical protein
MYRFAATLSVLSLDLVVLNALRVRERGNGGDHDHREHDLRESTSHDRSPHRFVMRYSFDAVRMNRLPCATGRLAERHLVQAHCARAA